jgi:hypothetical protein
MSTTGATIAWTAMMALGVICSAYENSEPAVPAGALHQDDDLGRSGGGVGCDGRRVGSE